MRGRPAELREELMDPERLEQSWKVTTRRLVQGHVAAG